MIWYEDMKPIEHVLLHRYAHFLTWCAHANTGIQYEVIFIHTEVDDELITSKNPDLTRFFINKPRYLGQLKEKCLLTVTWSEHLMIYCRVIATQ